MNHIRHSIELAAPVPAVFAYYADPANVARMAPPQLNVRLVHGDSPVRLGSRVVFAIRPRMVPFDVKWTLEISEFEKDRLFVDRLRSGPFAHWVHRHLFDEVRPGVTRVTDEIEFGAPVPLFSWVVRTGFVQDRLRELFAFREQVLRDEFESSGRREGEAASSP